MKIALSAVAALALPHSASALRKVQKEAEDDRRDLMSFTLIFDECVGKTAEECVAIVEQHRISEPELFEHRESLNYDVKKVRERTDNNYHIVGLRTNEAETGVVGIKGDGMVYYPYDWCVPDNSAEGSHCYEIGPWDCDVGIPLSVDECCNMIKATVPDPDVNGRYIDCYPSYPVGSVDKPVDYGHVLIVTDANGIVVRPATNE